MIRNKNIFIVVILLSVFSSCIGFFHPNLGNEATAKFVVDGQITDKEGFQTVLVSMTSTTEKPNYNPLSYCKVTIIDNQGNVFNLKESPSIKGSYSAWIGKAYLKPGNSYHVKVVTASGIEIVSDFDQMPECPKVDSIYYIRKDIPTRNPDIFTQGIQFYIDLDVENTNSHYYRWNLTETWEHHAFLPRSIAKSVCWTTKDVKNIYILSTKNLIQNKFLRYPLHFVDNKTARLNFCYSLLVNQFALSEAAYIYWDNLRKNSNEQGGLYNAQPLTVEGNLKSITNPDLKVLGFFSASSVKSKRIFVQNVPKLILFQEICEPDPQTNTYSIGCTECDYISGTTTKPNFWPY